MASVSNKLQRQDTGVVTSATKKPLLNLFANRNDCKYTPCYCEENVWQLCAEVRSRLAPELAACSVAFVSNEKRTVPLWRQRAGRHSAAADSDPDAYVVWDYHVLLLYAPDDRCLVYDLDSELPFPTHLHRYVTETFRNDHILERDLFRFFRVLPAALFLQHFSSDRRHMRRADGSFVKPPPDTPPIRAPHGPPHNLDDFINMDPTKGLGQVLNLTQLVEKFYPPKA